VIFAAENLPALTRKSGMPKSTPKQEAEKLRRLQLPPQQPRQLMRQPVSPLINRAVSLTIEKKKQQQQKWMIWMMPSVIPFINTLTVTNFFDERRRNQLFVYYHEPQCKQNQLFLY
jgi:hypothetical protein